MKRMTEPFRWFRNPTRPLKPARPARKEDDMLSRRTILASVAVAGVALVSGVAAFAQGHMGRGPGMM